MKKLNLVLSIAAGLFGGVLSHYAWARPVHAESVTSAPKEVVSQRFVLVDGKGNVQGAFSFDERKNDIRLLDGEGREIWRAGGNGMQFVGGSKNPK